MKEKEREKDEKERDREKEREREKGREKDRDREKDREKIRDKEKEKLKAKEKDRDAEKKKDRGKEQEREKDNRGREHDKDRGKDQEREKERVKDSERERDKDRDKGVDKEKKKEKDRSKKDRDKEREKEKERDREKEKAGEREKIVERETKEKEREKVGDREKDREKLGERDKEQERDNVGDREKEREKAGERERERDKERDKDREREKEREREEKERQKSRLKEKERGREHDRERDGRDREHERDWDGRDKEREHERDRDRDREARDRDRQKERDYELEGRDRKRDDKLAKESANFQTSTSLFERVAKMREQRQRTNAEHRASAKRTDPEDDIKSWVNKSRTLELHKKREEMDKAARMAKILSEQDVEEEDDDSDYEARNSGYGGKDLAGLKVRHGLDKVMEGGAVVLTLKDTSVLDGDDVNEATDELENIEMAQQIAREDAYKAAKKTTGIYVDKFNNDINAAPRTILPQYDDIVRDEGVVLDETGGINEESKKKLEEARRRLETVSARESLLSTLNIASDYLSQEDMLQFKKPKKKKKLRKKDKLDLDELESEAIAAGLGKEDLGSRNFEARRERKQLDEKADAEARKNAYDIALKKGQDASRMLREGSTAQAMEVEEIENPVFGGEEDEDLYKSLEKARQVALKNQREAAGPQSIAARLVALSQQSAQTSQTSSGIETDENRLVFTDTGEFCRSLQLDDVIIRRAGAKDAFGEEDEEPPPVDMEEDTTDTAGGWTEVSEVDKIHPSAEEEDDSAPVEEPIKDVSVGKGLAGALMLLQERGTFRETVDWGGRNMDKKRSKLVGIIDESNNQVGQRDILLDRVDEFGRTMTPKEAFRKLSHKFHGKGPGKMKQEKRMKQWQEELRLKQMNSGDTPLMSMEKMREAQAKMHTPYIVISGHIKPGQTSDPRSGFATVEKEPIGSLTPMLGDQVGSLTPMLGDKKVEHFLGIKRKPEPGSMGPPPPKQPKMDRH